MSALTDRIAAEHMPTRTSACTCGGMRLGEYYPRHIATVTEAAVREQVARDIEAMGAGPATSARIARGGAT